MQGRPLPAKTFQLGLGAGNFPDLLGAVPEFGFNPDVSAGPSTTATKPFLTVGAGIGEWVDVGLSSSRGLYSTVKLVRARGWSLSVSPAYYRLTVDAEEEELWVRASNRNVTGLLAFQVGAGDGFTLDFYTGTGISWYSVEIRDRWRRESGASPNVVAGITVDGGRLEDLIFDPQRPPGEADPGERSDEGVVDTIRIGLELMGAWITQRNGRRDYVRAFRILVALQSWPAW